MFDEAGDLVSAWDLNTIANNTPRKYGFGVSSSVQSNLSDDVSQPIIKPAGDLMIHYGVNPWFSLMLDGGAGQFSDRNNFKTDMIHADFKGIFTLFPNDRFSPYVSLGGSVFNFWAKDNEGVEIERERDWHGWKPAIVSGVGLEYFISKRLALHTSWNYYFTFTDELDGNAGDNKKDAFWKGQIGLIYYLR